VPGYIVAVYAQGDAIGLGYIVAVYAQGDAIGLGYIATSWRNRNNIIPA